MSHASERARRNADDERIARCHERVLAGLPGESPVTVVEMLLIAKRIREGDEDGRLPGETGHAPPVEPTQPPADPFPMFPI